MPVEATPETLVAVSRPATGRALDTLAAAEARAQRTPLEADGRSSGFGLDFGLGSGLGSGLEGWQKWQSQAFRSYAHVAGPERPWTSGGATRSPPVARAMVSRISATISEVVLGLGEHT